TLGTTSVFNGNILGQTAIVLNTGATLNGIALAQTAVTLDAVTVSLPAGTSGEDSSPAPLPIQTPTPAPTPATSPVAIVQPPVTTTRVGNTIEVTSVDAVTREAKNIRIEAELPVEVKENTIRVTQSNGALVEVKVMPATASATAIASLRIKACAAENNCTIKLKEVSVNGAARAAYAVSAEKEFRIFGLVSAKSMVSANIDAETGAVVSVIKPWWAFFAIEVN
ncbi:MAG: ice-binding family protein, partial [archaeon]|nr:ice-binding family protein [archaeon]